uniref:Peptidoglycan D,D-transpeptidase MrdA n=1 Tax=Candidatus Kentrum sp. FM TaxID=2126340 RepID=A0A450VWH9_9GAMM|nr:MAG: penicillin-binding protein 2 [Candidatus Kentron sp. FM]VFJ56913.1 MAG: penicillin-binding protein 2 [Candidatus Kentron sp. FM]VFK09173.1 MAG: penicillin-binding protein 2 [Candidatus Kentron sp. FM]
MQSGLTIKNIAGELNLFRSRVVAAYYLVIILSLVLITQLAKLQIFEHEHFRTLSLDNRVRLTPLPPTRGFIFDRHGVVLARNTSSYSLEVVPEEVLDMEAMLREITGIIDIDKDDRDRFLRLVNRTHRFQSIPLKHRLTETEVARFSVNRHRFPGVDIQARLTRDYPQGSIGVHAIGYVGRINEKELARVDPVNYRGTNYTGKTGVEQAYENLLHGRVGYQHVEVNAQGRTLRVLASTPPVPGTDLYLTIDVSLQAVAETALKGENGAVVAIDPASGAVLALASMPGFDPNPFVHGIKEKAYRVLRTSPDRPLFNRALFGQYPPGSTIKPFVGFAGLEHNPNLIDRRMLCSGSYRLQDDKRLYRDWKRSGHGRVNLHRAMVESCDVYFYQLSFTLGIDKLHHYLTEFGFGRKTGLDLFGEMPGLVPSRAWKRKNRNQIWFPGETLITGIGQGFLLATPLQLATATAALATRGTRFTPRIIDRMVKSTGKTVIVSPVHDGTVEASRQANWDSITDAMIGVVHETKGTARKVGIDCAYRMAGKTGTAQVFSLSPDEEYNQEKLDKKLHDHGLFIAFAPAHEPRIAIAVVVENGGAGSQSAAPIARTVLDHYLSGYKRPQHP